jgi:exodeoxyribonuclease V alpha subunit
MCVEVPDTHKFIQNGFSGWNSQGQEYDVIVLPLLSTFGRQLQRNLLYTAITRARKKVLIVGQASAVTKAVQNDAAEHRKTLLAFRIAGSMGGGGTSQGV